MGSMSTFDPDDEVLGPLLQIHSDNVIDLSREWAEGRSGHIMGLSGELFFTEEEAESVDWENVFPDW